MVDVLDVPRIITHLKLLRHSCKIVSGEEVMSQSKVFGNMQPWAEPSWYSGRPSPYYTDSHRKLRDYVRNWIDQNLASKQSHSESSNKLYQRCADDGLLLPIALGKKIPQEYASFPILAGIKTGEWDGFHDMILWSELYRDTSILPSAIHGLVVGFPPLHRFGSQKLRSEIIPEILRGTKRLCFAVTEPDSGSDIKNITSTATKSADGKNYVVNGEKKWITNGTNSDFYMTLVRTGGEGLAGLSLLLIPHSEGVHTRSMELSLDGQETTAYITFEDALVPISYLIGVEGQGFRYVVSNFNHERLLVAFQALSLSRVCLLETMSWANKRVAFGKTLIQQPVVRWKFANMARKVESLQAWTEQVVYEVQNLDQSEADRLLAGVTALLKAQSGMVLKYVADECQKTLGGLGMTKTGQGAKVEAIVRRALLLIIPGGTEDVMLDFGTREALKVSQFYNQSLSSKI